MHPLSGEKWSISVSTGARVPLYIQQSFLNNRTFPKVGSIFWYLHGGARNPDCLPGTNGGAGELLAPLDLNVALHAIWPPALGSSGPCSLDQQDNTSNIIQNIFHILFKFLLPARSWLMIFLIITLKVYFVLVNRWWFWMILIISDFIHPVS